MTTLGTMATRIADELARSDLLTQTYDAIRSACDHYASERWWFNEVVALTLTTTSSVDFYALPTNFEHIDCYSIYIGNSLLDIDQQHFDTINYWQTGNTIGQPTDFALYGGGVVLYPMPDQQYMTILSYVKTPTALVNAIDSNEFMTFGEELIRSRARADIQINFLRDEGMTAEYMVMAQSAQPFYSHRERSAYDSLRRRSVRHVTTGKIRPVTL